MLDPIFNLIFPPQCVACGDYVEDKHPFCQRCRGLVVSISHDLACKRCGVPVSGGGGLCDPCRYAPPRFEQVVGLLEYESVVRDAIQSVKVGGRSANGRAMAVHLRGLVQEQLGRWPAGLNVCVPPPHLDTLRERGFYFPFRLARWWGFRVRQALRPVKQTAKQAKLDRVMRSANLSMSMQATGPLTGDWLVVDDVMTTGATLNECARALRTGGADRVFGLTLARVT